jgi:hypothetical protein
LYVSIPRSITSLLNVKYGPTPCKWRKCAQKL